MMRKNEVRDEYYKSLQNLGLKEGAKVRVDFPEGQLESSIYIDTDDF
jgi:predicted DNA-binding antitoxin AbrB/MazE fold protein